MKSEIQPFLRNWLPRLATAPMSSDYLVPRLLLLLLLGSVPPAFGQATNQAKQAEYSDFRIITERNIFSPRRYRSGLRSTQPVAKVDSFTLVGTMTYEKGPLAFFEGTSSEYRKVLKPEESIAGYKLTNIGFSAVKLVNQTNEVDMPVGMQMRREENGPWQLAAALELPGGKGGSEPPGPGSGRPGAVSEPSSASAEPAAAEQPASTAAAGGGADDVLKRLMQRREQEINR